MQKNYIVENRKLDNNQMKLLLNDNNSLVIAGAGSGKTLTIIGKINFIIETKKILPSNILIISFTNASVNDLKNRIKHDVQIYTFHKLAMHILEKKKINYSICKNNLLDYVIKEYLLNCDFYEQKIILKFLKLNINYKRFLKTPYYFNLCKLVEKYINVFKTNNYKINDFEKINYSKIEKKFILIIFKIYHLYIEEKNSTSLLDFDDLIFIATNYVKETKLCFKYILIDEFQDTSFIRLNLIKEIFKYNNSKIIVVGDDWQSIYHFTGCNLHLFLNFSEFFPNVETIKLVNTYRNSQELIQIAADFIQKNEKQIKKNLFSNKHSKSPIILAPYIDARKTLKNILDFLLTITDDILVLSRNNNDIYDYLDNELQMIDKNIIYKNKKIRFMTIHKSKGLEAKYTIILNCNNSYLGFPNKIENNKIIDKLFSKEIFPYAEERRLFYVALTRCKDTTYIMYNKNTPSIFVKEIKKIIKNNLGKITYFK